MDPMELSSLNELLDRIAALGVATNYDRIGLKPDQREINSPPVTHQISDGGAMRRFSLYPEDELCPREDIALTLNLESGSMPNLRGNIPEPELQN